MLLLAVIFGTAANSFANSADGFTKLFPSILSSFSAESKEIRQLKLDTLITIIKKSETRNRNRKTEPVRNLIGKKLKQIKTKSKPALQNTELNQTWLSSKLACQLASLLAGKLSRRLDIKLAGQPDNRPDNRQAG